MKSFIFSLACILLCTWATAQPGNYVFSYSQNIPFSYLSPITSIVGPGWDDFDAAVPLGFTFNFMGASTSTISFDDTNFGNSGTDMIWANGSNYNVISTFYDIEDRGNNVPGQVSTVGYKTDIVNNFNVTKIEWKNAVVYGTNNDTLNMQCWFHQQDNSIEFRIGPSHRSAFTNEALAEGFAGPIFGLFRNVVPMTLGGDAFIASSLSPATTDSTSFLNLLTNSGLYGIDSFPPANSVLRWGPAITVGSGALQLSDDITIYPSAVRTDLYVDITNEKKYSLQIYSSTGQCVKREHLIDANSVIDVSDLAPGSYYLQFISETKKVVYKIQKL